MVEQIMSTLVSSSGMGDGAQDSVSGTAIFTHEINLDLHAHVQDNSTNEPHPS